MKSGYSRETIAYNINLLMNAGMPRHRAIAESMNEARKSFFKKHPAGALPNALAFPKGKRLSENYDRDGKPLGELKRNPTTRTQSQDAQKAAERYHAFTGHDDIQATKIKIPAMPKAVLTVGDCDGILYTTIRDGVTEKYIHKFAKGSRPLLCASPDGKRLFLLGGAYNFTERGIVDKRR